ncbi:PEP/pyruvate-binding domain-containing protein [soil metagenome]
MTGALGDAAPLVLPLAECGLERLHQVGGKAARLGALQRAGFPGAPGFVLTTQAYRGLMSAEIARRVRRVLSDVRSEDWTAAVSAARRIRALIEDEAMPPDSSRAIAQIYAALAHDAGISDPPVAIRSSATAECLATHSFAGQQESFLWVRGAEQVVAHVRKVWSSLFSPQAILYRRSIGFPTGKSLMAVVIQRMVDVRTAGVTFTMNPSNGDRSKIAIEAHWGFGESVVSGEANPDRFMVEKATLQIIARTIAAKPWEYAIAAHGCGLARVPVGDGRRTYPCLSDSEVEALAALAKAVERRFGEPQDIEWAIDRHAAGGDGIVLLQSRPETAWKARPARSGFTPAPDAVSYVLRGLRGLARKDSAA